MKRLSTVVFLLLSVFTVSTATAGEWRLPVGLAYVNGFQDIIDQYENNLEAEGYILDSVEGVPVGISFQPYYQFDSGVGAGMGIGPVMAIFGDTDFLNVPINLHARYLLMPKADTSVYLRGGVSYNMASGDYVDGSEAGFLGGLGVEFMRDRKVGFGFEVGYDSSKISLDDYPSSYWYWGGPAGTKDIEPIGFTVSVFAVF